ncbi:MAG: hypothetical protein IT458_15690 [Planctomycetes bacterium]|nr:hypothetical protein [Planctomycetota bacterium]
MRAFARLVPLLLLGAAACASHELAEGEGAGLVTASREAPAGAETSPRPELRVGDRFVYRRGTLQRVAMRVTEAGADGYVLQEEETGLRLRFTPELYEKGQDAEGLPEVTRVLAPYDARYAWPLWVGKQWTVQYLYKAPGKPGLPFLAHYVCDAMETVQVKAGTFRCHRIWRRHRPAVEGSYVELATVYWYAPEVGMWVRRLDAGVVTELEEFVRQ